MLQNQVTFERSILDMWRDGWLCPLRAIRVTTTANISSLSHLCFNHYINFHDIGRGLHHRRGLQCGEAVGMCQHAGTQCHRRRCVVPARPPQGETVDARVCRGCAACQGVFSSSYRLMLKLIKKKVQNLFFITCRISQVRSLDGASPRRLWTAAQPPPCAPTSSTRYCVNEIQILKQEVEKSISVSHWQDSGACQLCRVYRRNRHPVRRLHSYGQVQQYHP